MQRPLGQTHLRTVLQWLIHESCDCSGGLSATVFKPGHEGPRFAAIQAQFWQSRSSINCEQLRENNPSSFSTSNNKKPTLATQSFRKHLYWTTITDAWSLKYPGLLTKFWTWKSLPSLHMAQIFLLSCCTGSGRDGVHFLHNSLYGAVF